MNEGCCDIAELTPTVTASCARQLLYLILAGSSCNSGRWRRCRNQNSLLALSLAKNVSTLVTAWAALLATRLNYVSRTKRHSSQRQSTNVNRLEHTCLLKQNPNTIERRCCAHTTQAHCCHRHTAAKHLARVARDLTDGKMMTLPLTVALFFSKTHFW